MLSASLALISTTLIYMSYTAVRRASQRLFSSLQNQIWRVSSDTKSDSPESTRSLFGIFNNLTVSFPPFHCIRPKPVFQAPPAVISNKTFILIVSQICV